MLELRTWTKVTIVIVDNYTYQQKIYNFASTNNFPAL